MRHPKLPGERKVTFAQTPSQRSAERAADTVAEPRGGGGQFPNLIIQQEKLEHAMKPLEIFSLQSGKDILSQRQTLPFLERLRLFHSQFAQLGPDRDAWIRRENVR